MAGELRVSVVIPTCGRPELLHRCLAALVQQRLDPHRFEIIVVDDRPSPSTREIVMTWVKRMGRDSAAIRYLANHGPHGPAAARNRGWEIAQAPIIAFTDDDTVPAPDWLYNGLAAFDDEVAAVWGRIEMPLAYAPTDYERDAQRLQDAGFVTANCFCLREVLQALRGFDERFRYAWREDSDLYFRLLDSGARIVHAPQAIVVHPVRPAGWGVSLRQQKKILFDALLYKKHPRRYRQAIRATPRWDYYLIVAALLIGIGALAAGYATAAAISGAVWLGMTARFCLHRLSGTRRAVSHVAEMVVTSILIPPLAVFWRMVGAMRFQVAFV